MKVQRRLVEECVVLPVTDIVVIVVIIVVVINLPHEFTSNLCRGGRFHDHCMPET